MPASGPLPFDALDLPPEEIERRFRWARRQGHPSYVWPDLSMARWAEAAREIEVAVRTVLSRQGDDRAPELRSGGEGDTDGRAMCVAAFTSGVGPLLGRWIEDGTLRADPQTAALLQLHLRHARARAVRVLGVLERLAPGLAELDPPPVLLKGVHTAWTCFPEPGCRTTADIDILVTPGTAREAERWLAQEDFHLERRQRRPGRSVWRSPDTDGSLPTLELNHALGPLTVDLHDSLERDFLGVRSVSIPRPPPGACEPVPGLPSAFRGLPPPQLLLSLALHASADPHGLQLVRVVEIILVARRAHRTPWPDVFDLAEGAHGLRFAWPALSMAERLAPGTVPSDVLDEAVREVPRRLRRTMDAVTPGTALRLDGLSLEERLMGAGSAWEFLRRLGHMILPGRAGNSPRELARIYRERLYRLARGRVTLRRRPGP